MKLKTLAITAALLCSTSLTSAAFASTDSEDNSNNNNSHCYSNCNSNEGDHNSGDYGHSGDNEDGGGTVHAYGGNGGDGGQGGQGGQGGNGGQGGQGGYGQGGQGGQGGKVENDNHNDSHNTAEGGYATATGGKVDNEISNHNDSHNTATAKQDQEQEQKQTQSISHSGNSKIENSGNSRNTNKNENNNDNSNSNNANQQVNIDNRSPRAPVNTAYAAPLSVGEDTCMGSSSVGGQGFAFGLSIGTTWTDSNCQRLKNSRQLASLGYQRAAVALVCIDDSVREAMTAAGTPCPSANDKVAEAPMVAPVVVAAPAAEPAREWTTSMAPVPDPVRHQRKKKAHKALPPK